MRKILTALFATLVCCLALAAVACDDGNKKEPVLIKQGEAITLQEGESRTVNLSEYIDAEGTEYSYSVSSENPAVATASVDGSTMTVAAVAEGQTSVTASAGEVSATFSVTVNAEEIVEAEPVFEDKSVEYDLYFNASAQLTLAPKTEAETYSYAYALAEPDDNVEIDGNVLTVSYAVAVEKTLTVNVTYTNGSGEQKNLSFAVSVAVTDTRAYRAVNGSFNDGLTGWTMDGEIGAISSSQTFWGSYPMNNDGDYFSGESVESAKGSLASSAFTVGGSGWITFKLGAAGNSKCYITLEDGEGNVLAVWRNAQFADLPGGDYTTDEYLEMIGVTVFACNFVTYKADLSEYKGNSLRLVLRDEGESGFGFFNFDELITYYPDVDALPDGAVAVVNELADKTALAAAVEEALTQQGDYTSESFETYSSEVTNARAVLGYIGATQTETDVALAALAGAYSALALRTPSEVAGAEKAFRIISGNSKEIALSDYVDTAELSKITYAINADEILTVGDITDGKFTITAGAATEDTVATVAIAVSYDGETVLTVTLSVTVTSEVAPKLKAEAVELPIDLYTQENKESITLDFSGNIDNAGGLDLTYSVSVDGGEAQTAEDGAYTFAYGQYSDKATEVVFNVTVKYTANGSQDELTYTYTLILTDTTPNRVANGSFETGDLTGWTLSESGLGAVSDASNYWVGDADCADGYSFNKSGNYLFSAYADGSLESATGTLVSSVFTIGGSGWITYSIGAAKSPSLVYIEIVESTTGEILDRFGNEKWSEYTNDVKSGCTLIPYKANLSAHIGKQVFIKITDIATANYGLFFVDAFETYYASAPSDEFNTATSFAYLAYSVANSGFESGNLDGWTILTDGMSGGVISAETYWGEQLPYNQAGNYHLDGWNTGIEEADTWSVRSTSFVLGGTGYISVRMGGNAAAVKVYKADGTLIGYYTQSRFSNTNFPYVSDGSLSEDGTPNGGSWADMGTYFMDLREYIGETLYIELCDVAVEGSWAVAFFDEVVTYYETIPDIENGYDVVTAPVSKKEDESYNYGELKIYWTLAENKNETATA